VVKPPFRTKTLSTKVSDEEFTQLEAAASKSGLTISEWCREAILAGLNGQEPKSGTDSAGPGSAGTPGGVAGATSDPAQCALQASERPNPHR
jgi:mobilization protein NikA